MADTRTLRSYLTKRALRALVRRVNRGWIRIKPRTETERHLRRLIEQDVDLVNLGGKEGPDLEGIFAPNYDEFEVGRYIQGQFLEHAEDWAKRYEASAYFGSLIRDALATAAVTFRQRQRPSRILDLGSGSGNTIFPLLELFPRSFVVASDLSVAMLKVLRAGLLAKYHKLRCALLQLNAEDLFFVDQSFDFVVGGAVLHHMIYPDRTIAGCARVLKPGGYAIFFEPFEEGCVLVRNCCEAVVNDSRSDSLSPEVRQFLPAWMYDVDVRKQQDKPLALMKRLDDKWLFRKSYFEDLARAHGFAECTIHPLGGEAPSCEKYVESLLHVGLQKQRDALPPWAWETIRATEERIPEATRRESLIEGCIIFKR
jgi:ubiquinone/menaquinone biosynthesis C-methylase UbiE